MLNWLFGNGVQKSKVDAYVSRIAFLMEHFEPLAKKPLGEVLRKLDSDFSLGIAENADMHGDPNGRLWADPNNSNLQFGLTTFESFFPADPRRYTHPVKQFYISSACEELGPLQLYGSATDDDIPKLHWTVSNDSELETATPLGIAVEAAMWHLPGWKAYGSVKDKYRYLEKG